MADRSRRSFVLGMLAAPAAFVAARAVAASRASVRALRPPPDGSSSTRCGLCGSLDHPMLRCPSAPRVI